MSHLTLTEARRFLARQVAPRDPRGPPPRQVSIQHTPLEVTVQSDDGTLVKPWVTVFIDIHSKTIIGFDVSAERPGHGAVVDCLKGAVLPRQNASKRARR